MSIQISFFQNISLNYNSQTKNLILTGPLGSIQCYLNKSYISHQNNILILNKLFISPSALKSLQHLNLGLTIGFRKKIFQNGIWTIMNKNNNLLKFQLGLSHPTYFEIPKNVLFHSKREGQFRTINLFSIHYELIAQTAAKIIQLKPADVYRLNGFRYALLPIYCITSLTPQTNLASGFKSTKINIKTRTSR